MHVCWGNYEGPHHHDVPMERLLPIVLKAKPQGLLFEAANPRHAHEWVAFRDTKMPDDKILIPGVLATTTNYVEHPLLVAERLETYAGIVGRDRVIAGTDCGFGTFAGFGPVEPDIVYMKLASLVEGARIASERLWRKRIPVQTRHPIPAMTVATPPAPAPDTPSAAHPTPFRFYDNRQKYLAFVNTCNEKSAIARRAAEELKHIRPTPPAIRLFDAGMGDGTVLARLMRSVHRQFPTVPMLVVAKEISLEDVRLGLEKLPDRLFEHPGTVFVVTNLTYAEAPRLMSRDLQAAASLNWQEVRLSGSSAHEYAEQIEEIGPTLAHGWQTTAQPQDRQPHLRPPVGARDLSRRSQIPARRGDSQTRTGIRKLRSDPRLATVARPHVRKIQSRKGARPAGSKPRAGRPAARDSIVWPRSGAGNRAAIVAGRESVSSRSTSA